jgi:uncharacterized protein YgfB (UPF0149 family)
LLCALLVQDVSSGTGQFLQKLFGEAVDPEKGNAELTALYRETLKQLQDPLLGLELLLPDEDESLNERILAASQWAGGFLIGWLKTDQHDRQQLSTEITDFVDDCKVLATTEYQTDADDSDDEQIYAELVEYLRMGALLVQEELQPIKAAPQIH